MDKKKIIVEAWLKNNIEWFTPAKPENALDGFKNVELLAKGYYGDLFYAWNDEKINGRLFRGRWNDGVR